MWCLSWVLVPLPWCTKVAYGRGMRQTYSSLTRRNHSPRDHRTPCGRVRTSACRYLTLFPKIDMDFSKTRILRSPKKITCLPIFSLVFLFRIERDPPVPWWPVESTFHDFWRHIHHSFPTLEIENSQIWDWSGPNFYNCRLLLHQNETNKTKQSKNLPK